MRKIIIFGNSGSGKSTLAKALSAAHGLAHLDLDTLAWEPTFPPARRPIADSNLAIERFVDANERWVIEGCYTDLLTLVACRANQMIYLNLPVTDCISNAKSRPWEPHKYATRAAQDANLPMLIAWIEEYAHRADTFSAAAHQELYRQYTGNKTMLASNRQSALHADG